MKEKIKEILDKFSGLNEEGKPCSILVVENKSIDMETQHFVALSAFSTIEPYVNIYIVNDFIILDIIFKHHLNNDFVSLDKHYKLFTDLCETNEGKYILNTTSLILNDEENEEALILNNPIFFSQTAILAGRPINAIRLAFNKNDLIYNGPQETVETI